MTVDDPVVGDGFVWLGLRIPDESELQSGMDALGIPGVSAVGVLSRAVGCDLEPTRVSQSVVVCAGGARS